VKETAVSLEDDSSISEINILPDGRICLFGASQQVLDALDAIPLGDPALKSRIDCLRTDNVEQVAEPNTLCSPQNDGPLKNRNETVTP
jgi:hypothetical protein